MLGLGISRVAAALGSVLFSFRIKRIRDKYEVELQELERSERKLQERCNELKGRLVELEGESIRLQGLLKHKEQEVEEIRKVSREQGWGVCLQHAASQHEVTPVSPCRYGTSCHRRGAAWQK